MRTGNGQVDLVEDDAGWLSHQQSSEPLLLSRHSKSYSKALQLVATAPATWTQKVEPKHLTDIGCSSMQLSGGCFLPLRNCEVAKMLRQQLHR